MCKKSLPHSLLTLIQKAAQLQLFDASHWHILYLRLGSCLRNNPNKTKSSCACLSVDKQPVSVERIDITYCRVTITSVKWNPVVWIVIRD